MANKRNTKMVLASLLATSAIVPAVAASAEVGGDITRSVEAGEAVTTSVEATPISADDTTIYLGEISYTVEDTTNQLAKYLNGPASLIEVDGQKVIVIELDANVAKMIVSATVDGESIVVEEDGTTSIAILVDEDLAPVEGELTLFVAAINTEMSTEFKFIPGELIEEETETTEDTADVETGEGSEEDTDVVADVAPLKYAQGGYGDILDGSYPVTFDAYKPETGEGNYQAITRHLDPEATLVVENGEYFLEINEIERLNDEGVFSPWIQEYQVLIDGEYVSAETVEGEFGEYPHVVRLPLTSLNDLTTAKLHVVAPEYNMDHWYPFDIAIDPGQALPELVPTYVYKDGTNELSIMQETYLSSTSVVFDNGDGTYLVDLEFPKGQFLVGDLEFNGQTYAVTEETEDEEGNTISIYTVEVDDLSKIYNATFDLDVAGFYKQKHTAQIQFGGEQNPFGDIAKNWAYSHVVSLYNKGIFTTADKFNPSNNLQRGHFALMLARAFELDVPETTKFTDLPTKDAEQVDAIKALNAYGIINGKTTTTFVPGAEIKRFEAALMIDRLLKKYNIETTDQGASFTDIANQTPEAKAAITKLANLEIIGGKGEGKFDPTGTLTRAEMAKILDNALKLIEKQ